MGTKGVTGPVSGRLLWLSLGSVLLLAAACGSGSASGSASGSGSETVSASADETSDEVSSSDDVSDQGGPVVADVDSLPGSSWTLKFGGGPDGEIELVDGWPITLTFEAETLGGTAACNGYGSGYSTNGQRFLVEGIGSNEMGCEAAVQAAEQGYFAALRDVDGINLIDDELALSGPSTELIFVRTASVATGDLVGTLWLLETMTQGGESTPVEGEPATLLLSADGTVSGGTGCRTLSGTYTVFGSEVQFPNFGADGDCPSTLRDQDGLVVTVLGDGFVPEVDDQQLTLTSVGNEGLGYRAITEDELSTMEGTPVVSDAELLEGVVWIFVGGDGPDGPLLDPRTISREPQRITLTFTAGGYQGEATCNRYGGQAKVGNGRITLGVAEGEEEGCGEPFDAMSAAYYQALPNMAEFGLEANGAELVMNGEAPNGDGFELWFEREE